MDTLPGGNGAAAPGGVPGDLVKDVDTAGFMTEVIEASQSVPVIVDFWAPWCGPCKQLGPVIEKLVTEAGGAVRLAKVDIDQNQQLAQQLRVQSIPMVYAFVGGRPVDGFQGALPESEVKAFIDRVIAAAGTAGDAAGTSAAAEIIAEGKAALAKGDDGTAMQLFAKVLESDDNNVEALAGLARCYIAAGEHEAARNLLSDIPEEHADHPDVAAVRSSLDLMAESAGAGGVAELEAKVAAAPADLQARFDLAMARFGAGDREGAVNDLLEAVRRNPGWNDGAARKQLLKMFEAWGPEDPLTVEGRERLSTVLFS
ncbi:MAG: co-chaperone YbbN [Alphaproteobacteria bacterium]|nr:co-chaperone YbbN [Alphaproteobacteria bacterium]